MRVQDPVTLALALALGAGWFGFPGLLWDVAWHRSIGRDTFFSPPHALMYTGVAVNGLVAAWAVLWGRRRHGAPAAFALGAVGFLLALAGAALDEWWHGHVGKDVNLWSPPHLVGLAGTVLIAVGLMLALAAHTRYARGPGWLVPRVILLFGFADLVHKAMVALDHYTLDPWGRTPDFYPFLLALLLPAVFLTAVRALGPGAATAAAVVFTAEHLAINLVLQAAGMRTATLTPIPILPALAVDLVAVAFAARGGAALVAVAGGLAFALTTQAQEAAWMAWVVARPWPLADVVAAAPRVALAATGSAWAGWALGGFVRGAGAGRPAREVFGSAARARGAGAAMLVLAAAGLAAAYRPSRAEPPASLAALALAPDTGFDHRDAVFWEPLLPDGWRAPGAHAAYQEAIVDGRGIPVGPTWCGKDEAALGRELATVRVALAINGEAVDLRHYPRTRRRTRDGSVCEWVGVSVTAPRPGFQALVYTVERDGAAPSRVTVRLRVKEP
ncbi:MAG: hypothetical protein A2X36_02090 [Elusimicrobia bacterium GWA2_69_24]|nr:MAG: hypothetical protein A2W08_16835 [Candidatus Rokubacteria bacterium RBG_16_73_20]OGR60842.1 MAG: hypothetical protein A2X36_02090 [Elusimicrobia bacterium GWA2_69_24]HBH00825.1 hypothetical protein [Candidatus Rokubacteria bacterium]